jgi:hypothetical protein
MLLGIMPAQKNALNFIFDVRIRLDKDISLFNNSVKPHNFFKNI